VAQKVHTGRIKTSKYSTLILGTRLLDRGTSRTRLADSVLLTRSAWAIVTMHINWSEAVIRVARSHWLPRRCGSGENAFTNHVRNQRP